MFRFVPPSGQTVSTEMAVTSCGSSDIVGPAVVLQFRNVTNVDSLASMIGLVADMPDGDVLMTALRRGPLAGLPVDTVSFYSVHPDEEVLRLRGGSGFDEQLRKEFGVLPVNDRHPMGQAVLSGESYWTGLTALFERFPFAANDARRLPAYGRGEAVCMPIVSRASVIGTWFTVFSTPVHQTIARLEKFRAIGHLLGHWLLMSSGQGAVLQTVPRSMPFHTSERELVILRLIEDGKSNLQIAQKLGYSEATVRADLSRLYRRLGVAGRREVVAKAREVGLYAG
jgi:DNA-binding CsgD family transcriptional regulator